MATHNWLHVTALGRSLRNRAAAVLAVSGVLMTSMGLMFVAVPAASAHTGVLQVRSTCLADGTYMLTYSGTTSSVPASGKGHTATLTVGEIKPIGTTVSGAPSTVVGNHSYSWTQIVPGTTTYAQSTAFLRWGDGATSDPIGKIELAGTCEQPHEKITAPAPKVNPPTCATEGSVEWTTFPHGHWDGVTGTGPGEQSATPVADAHYALTNPGKVTVTVPAKSGLDCRGVVSPVAPEVTQSVCTGPGSHSEPSVTLADAPAGVSYSYDEATNIVTATSDGTHKLAGDLPDGWVRVSDTKATYKVTSTNPGDCLVDTSVDTKPSATPATCDTVGTLVLPTGTGFHWTGQTANTPGDHTVTAVADDGYTLTGQTEFSVHVQVQGEDSDCRGIVSPAVPTVSSSQCTGPGTSSEPVVTLPSTSGITYSYDKATATVTATADSSGKFAAELPTGWVRVSDSVATYKVALADAGSCAVQTGSLNYPTVTPPTCDAAGTLVVPDAPTGVVVTQVGEVPGDVSFTYAPAAGYALPAGAVTQQTVTVLPQKTGVDCAEVAGVSGSTPAPVRPAEVKGVQATRPHSTPHGTPHSTPQVLGTQAALPTAVDAGLAGQSQTDVRVLIGQALLGGGLLLLVGAGWSGLGRRRSGNAPV